MQHSARKHAKYSASSAHRWIHCTGSIALAGAVEDESGSYALDGTEAHELLEFALRERYRDADEAFIFADLNWTHRHDKHEERIESVQKALDYVYDILDAYEDAEMILEERFVFPGYDEETSSGMCDIVITILSISTVYVIDFKHGMDPVEIEDNEQVLFYTTGVSEATIGLYENYIGVIVQPRVFGQKIKETYISNERIGEFITSVDRAIQTAEQPNAPLNPGPKQCKWCPVSTTCPAREAKALAVVGEQFASVRQITADALPDVNTLSLERISYILQAEDMLRSWLKDVNAKAVEIIRSGGSVPGFKLVEAQAKSNWYGNELDIVHQFMALTGCGWDDIYPRKLTTITDAKRVIKDAYKARAPYGKKKQAAEDAEKALALLTIKDTSGNLTLVADTDKRPAVNLAQQSFAQVKAIAQNTDT